MGQNNRTPRGFATKLYNLIDPTRQHGRLIVIQEIADLLMYKTLSPSTLTPLENQDELCELLSTQKLQPGFDYLGLLLNKETLGVARTRDKIPGVVLTPTKTLQLCHYLLKVGDSNRVLDPCAATGNYPIHCNFFTQEKNITVGCIDSVEYEEQFVPLTRASYDIHSIPGRVFAPESFFDHTPDRLYDRVFLNPPYLRSEHKFISKALECLAPGGRLVAIVPTKVGAGPERGLVAWRENLLRDHTVESVTAFQDNPFGSITNGAISVLTFIAHQPHPDDQIVKFFQFDGDLENFTVDYEKPAAVNYSSPGRVQARITPGDEWHSETFYTHTQPLNTVNTSHSLFKIGDIFTIPLYANRKLARDYQPGHTPLYTQTILNNGVHSRVAVDSGTQLVSNVIVVNSLVGRAFYVPEPSVLMESMTVLSHPRMTPEIAAYVCKVINSSFSYSRGFTGCTSRLRRRFLYLPSVTVDGVTEPDWDFMHNHMVNS